MDFLSTDANLLYAIERLCENSHDYDPYYKIIEILERVADGENALPYFKEIDKYYHTKWSSLVKNIYPSKKRMDYHEFRTFIINRY